MINVLLGHEIMIPYVNNAINQSMDVLIVNIPQFKKNLFVKNAIKIYFGSMVMLVCKNVLKKCFQTNKINVFHAIKIVRNVLIRKSVSNVKKILLIEINDAKNLVPKNSLLMNNKYAFNVVKTVYFVKI